MGTETAQDSGWTVIDAFDVMVHLFLAEARQRYGLERLWRDAVAVPLTKILAQPKTKAAAKGGGASRPKKKTRESRG